MTHRRAVATMLLATLLWSIAGVVTRHLDTAGTFELTFWRSATNAVALALLLGWQRGFGTLWQQVRHGGRVLWLSGLCWTVMFTSFMVGLTLTTVANVLITMSLAPLFTALISRAVLGQRLPGRTWAAIVVAGIGVAWMYGAQVGGGGPRDAVGTLVALSVPIAGATMWTLLQLNARGRAPAGAAQALQGATGAKEQGGGTAPRDMTPAVLIGAVLSSLLTLPLSVPFQASASDIGWLTMLGVVQLAIPCVLAVAAGKVLRAPEASLLGLLEIIFGVAWTWLGTTESPTPAVLGGGGLVLAALIANEAIALRRPSATAKASA